MVERPLFNPLFDGELESIPIERGAISIERDQLDLVGDDGAVGN